MVLRIAKNLGDDPIPLGHHDAAGVVTIARAGGFDDLAGRHVGLPIFMVINLRS
jgi:hypothetical protein